MGVESKGSSPEEMEGKPLWVLIDKMREEGWPSRMAAKLKPPEYFMDFREWEDRVREALKEYLESAPADLTKEKELKACGAIIKYLIVYLRDPNSCTERAISVNLGIPRAKLRRLLGLMEWDEVIEEVPVGATKPYVIKNLSKALAKGYVSFSRVETEKITRILRHLGEGFDSPMEVLVRALYATLPNDPTMYRARLWALKLFPGHIHVHRPLFPYTVSSTNPGEDDYLLVKSYLDQAGTWPFGGRTSMAREALLLFNTLDNVTKEDFEQAVQRLAEKYLVLTMKSLEPTYQLLVEKGFEKGSQQISKITRREEILRDAGVARNDAVGRILNRWKFDPEQGYVDIQTQPLTPDHVRFAANILRAACRFAKAARASEEQIAKAEKMAETMESIAEGARPKT